MAFGLETASIKEPDLLILGVAGDPFFGSFTPDEGLTLSSSSGQVGVAEIAGLLPSSLLHFREKGEARGGPWGLLWAGETGCAEPLDRGVAPPPEQRPNLGNLETMADLKEAFSSMRRQQWHGGLETTPAGDKQRRC